ncbi:lung seven transmembrane receptor-domain-containing protein [Gorgonomyces haynaldii]|nr:lung seven transmembrane receptor-domain-containing protein [Gorgonomyces haynaldii]
MSCEGFYAKSSVPFPPHDSFVDVTLFPYSKTGMITVGIFKYEDRKHFYPSADGSFRICTQEHINQQSCSKEDFGKFMLDHELLSAPHTNAYISWSTGNQKRQSNETISTTLASATSTSSTPTSTQITSTTQTAVATISAPPPTITDAVPYHVNLTVTEDGLYCVMFVADLNLEDHSVYSLYMGAQNPYGSLPAIFYPALPLYAVMSAVYFLLLCTWIVLCWIYRDEVLRIQTLVGWLIFFLMIEALVNVGFFVDFNQEGHVNNAFLGVMVTFGAARESLSFFMLLVTSLGYGVVYPSLGPLMFRCVALTILHFMADALYSTYSMLTSDANATLLFLLGIPVTVFMLIFYVSIFMGMAATLQYLEDKNQTVKMQMYNRLWTILCASMVMVILIFIANAVNMSFRHQEWWIASQYKWRWLLLDGALYLNYFFTFLCIAILWLPNSRNQGLAMQQLATEDTEQQNHVTNIEMDEKKDTDEHVVEWAEQLAAQSTLDVTTAEDGPTATTFDEDYLIDDEEVIELK